MERVYSYDTGAHMVRASAAEKTSNEGENANTIEVSIEVSVAVTFYNKPCGRPPQYALPPTS